MLRTFIRFSPVNYCIEAQEECLEVTAQEYCEDHYDSDIPSKGGDTISFILDKTEYDLFINSIHLKAALTSCGIIKELNIAGVENSTGQLYFTCVIPEDTQNGGYEITIYKDYQLKVVAFTPETSSGACDASFTVQVQTAPAIEFEFSIDGVNWNGTGVFTGLCEGEYIINVREFGDEDCTSGTLEFTASSFSCLDFKGFTLQQFIDSGVFMIQLKDCTIEDLAP